MLTFRPLPQSFSLKNLSKITSRISELKSNPHASHIAEEMLHWFLQFDIHNKSDAEQYARQGRFDISAALTFPDADEAHLKTCLAFLYWGFSTDDLTDEGDFQQKPELVKASIDLCRDALYNLNSTPTYPYASMLQDLYKRISITAGPGTCARQVFVRAYEAFSESEIDQSRQRGLNMLPSVEDFIVSRRATFGAALIEAMVEYSLDIDLPEYVFEHKVIRTLSDATTDIMTWPNDLLSFNKEQADNDFQNLVCCIMVERKIELQEAIDVLTHMLDARVTEYLSLKKSLPSFGYAVDTELIKYLSALEKLVQGAVVSFYRSPRYFSKADRHNALKSERMVIKLRKAL